MAIVYSGPSVPGGEVSPGSGSSGFSSNAVPYVNSSGQLAASTNLQLLNATGSSAQLWLQSTQAITTNKATGPLVVGAASGPTLAIGQDLIQARSSVSGAAELQLNFRGGDVSFGAAAGTGKWSFNSTVNESTAVGAAGGAAALPATPEIYIKIRAANSTGVMTTLYLPAYLST